MIAFYVPGTPCGKQRARVLKTGRSYTPAKTVAYQAHVRGSAASDGATPDTPLDGPLEVSIAARMPIPKSWSKAKRAKAVAGTITPTGKPDLDNIAKAICDALNNVMWRDDGQIVSLKLSKVYHEAPGAWVMVERV